MIASSALTRLGAAGTGSLIHVIAPWGSGISGLITEWAASYPSTIVRIAIDTHAQEPVDLLDAINARLISLGHTRRGPRRGGGTHSDLPHLLGPSRAILVIENVENLTNPETLAMLQEHLLDDPHELTVLVAGRSLPDLDWPRIQRVRRTVTIGPTELRVSPADVLAALEQNSWRSPDSAAFEPVRSFVHQLVHFTDGWVAGVQVGLLYVPIALAEERDPEEANAAAWAHVRDYVRDQVIAQWDPADIATLTPLAIAGEASDLPAIAQDPTVTRWDHNRHLPLVRTGTSHLTPPILAPVVRDLLVERAVSHDPDAVASFVDRLLEQAYAAEDHLSVLALATRFHRAGDLIEILSTRWPEILLSGHVSLVSAALDQVPSDALAARASLLALRTALSAVLGDLGEAFHWLTFADAVRPPDEPTWSPGGLGPRNLIDFTFGLRASSLESIDPIALDPDVPGTWLGLHSVLHGFDLAVRGDPVAALGVLAAAAPFSAGQPLIELNRLSIRALAASLAGRTRERDVSLNAADRLNRRSGEGLARTLLLTTQLAERDLQLGKTASADARLNLALETIRVNDPWFRTPRVLAIAYLVGVAEVLGRQDAVDELTAILMPLMKRVEKNRGLSPDLLDTIRDAHDASSRPLTDPTRNLARPHISPAESRILHQLTTPKNVPRIAADLHVSVATVRTHIRSLYVKLSVSTRMDAVERAREWGLLP